MLISWFVVLVAVLGLLVYALAANPKSQELGRLAFFTGLFFTCWLLSGHTVRLG